MILSIVINTKGVPLGQKLNNKKTRDIFIYPWLNFASHIYGGVGEMVPSE
jgi:hypothetical protein